jgi:hypothetical protein
MVTKDLVREPQMQQRSNWFILFSALFLWVVVLPIAPRFAADSANESECVKCHTNVKGLIRLGWEIEKIKGKPTASREIAGEG